MRSLTIATVMVVLVGCPREKSGTTTTIATPQEIVAAGTAAIEQWRQAQEARNFDTLAKTYAHDNDVIVVQQGIPTTGWPAVESMLKARMTKSSIRVRLKDVQVASIAPEAVSAVAAMAREISDGVTTVTENGTITLVLRRDGDRWLIVAEHYSYKPT